jgi:hypothetical protein
MLLPASKSAREALAVASDATGTYKESELVFSVLLQPTNITIINTTAKVASKNFPDK